MKKYIFTVIIIIAVSTSFAKNTKVEDFKLKDYNGKEHSLNDFKESKAIVLMFIATQCPVSNAYNTRMKSLYDEYKSKDVKFIGINSNKQESINEVKSHAEENKLDFIILKDSDNKIADKLQATVTPEIFVLDKDFNVLYHGRIDDSRREDKVESHDLKNALDEILTNKEVSSKETKAFGCTIKRIQS